MSGGNHRCFNLFMGLLLVLVLSACASGKPEIRLNAGGLEMDITEEVPVVANSSLSDDGSLLLTLSFWKNTVYLWDMRTGAIVRTFDCPEANSPVALTPDGKYVLIGGDRLKLYEAATGRMLRTIGEDPAKYALSLSRDGRLALTTYSTGWNNAMIALYDVESGRKIKDIFFPDTLYNAVLSPDGRYALTAYSGGDVALWDISSGRVVNTFEGNVGAGSAGRFGRFMSLAFSPDGKYGLVGNNTGAVKLYDLGSSRKLQEMRSYDRGLSMTYTGFSPNGEYLITGGWDGYVVLWDSLTGREIRRFQAQTHQNTKGAFPYPMGVRKAFLSADGRYMVSQAFDGSVRIWKADTGEELAAMISFADGEWLAVTTDGYYNTSAKGAEYLKAQFGGKDYYVNQFYDVFYRPDIVAAKLRREDIRDLITITMNDAIKSPPPFVEFNPKSSATGNPRARICYQINDAGGGIGEVRLFHNGKLIHSDGFYKEIARAGSTQAAAMDGKGIYAELRGISLQAKRGPAPITSSAKGKTVADCREIDTVAGDNEVSIAAFNAANTVQSQLKTLNFRSAAKSDSPHLHILAVGIDQYRDPSINLKYAVKDARDLEDKLKAQSATLYKPENIHYTLLKDGEATKAGIGAKIDELTGRIRPQDTFIMFVAGHGVLLQNQYYMLTHDYSGSLNEQGMISSNEIVEMSKKIGALSQLFVFDTCHAGGVDPIVSGLYDARMSVLAKKMGLHIYASASDKQAAMDGYKGNGLFTYTLLEGLSNNRAADRNKDGKVSVAGLGEYARERTTVLSNEIGHHQTPLIINFGKDYPICQLR